MVNSMSTVMQFHKWHLVLLLCILNSNMKIICEKNKKIISYLTLTWKCLFFDNYFSKDLSTKIFFLVCLLRHKNQVNFPFLIMKFHWIHLHTLQVTQWNSITISLYVLLLRGLLQQCWKFITLMHLILANPPPCI